MTAAAARAAVTMNVGYLAGTAMVPATGQGRKLPSGPYAAAEHPENAVFACACGFEDRIAKTRRPVGPIRRWTIAGKFTRSINFHASLAAIASFAGKIARSARDGWA
jgi:hypothetical protein